MAGLRHGGAVPCPWCTQPLRCDSGLRMHRRALRRVPHRMPPTWSATRAAAVRCGKTEMRDVSGGPRQGGTHWWNFACLALPLGFSDFRIPWHVSFEQESGQRSFVVTDEATSVQHAQPLQVLHCHERSRQPISAVRVSSQATLLLAFMRLLHGPSRANHGLVLRRAVLGTAC